MPRRIAKPTPARPRRRTFLKQWRDFRGLTQERAAERFNMSAAQLSRIETGKQPYSQDFLELAAEMYMTDVASLLIRDPQNPDAIWTIWDQAKPGEKSLIVDIAKRVLGKAG